ncbi:MAG: hypothetical protein ABJZ55_16500 [Fuerstiella sp.]
MMSSRANQYRVKDEVVLPAGLPSWITGPLVEQTIRVWQPFYSQTLIPRDAIEILLSTDSIINALSEGSSCRRNDS